MVADFIPVDTCINLMVAVAWRTAVNHINPMPVRYINQVLRTRVQTL